MNYYEALNLLGVEEGFDEITLKNAYRQKAKQYHPDTTSIKDKSYVEEMMKKINLAYDTLVKQLKERNGKYSSYNNKKENQSQNKINNAAYIAMMKKDLEKYLPVKYFELLNEEPYASYIKIIKKFINIFSKTSPTCDIISITNAFMSAKENILNIIKDFIDLFCRLNNIPNKFTINILNLSFDEIYEKLLEAKKQRKVLEKYYKEKCESLKKYIPQKDNEYYHDYYQEIIEMISHFNNLNWVSINDINNEYSFIVNTIKSLYLQLKIKFKLDFNIKECDLYNLNYYCNLDEFYEQLLKIKDKYDIEIILKNKIEEETEKYKYYNEYNYAKLEIEEIKANTYKYILNNKELKEQFVKNTNNPSIKDEFSKMHNKIIKIFAEGFEYKKEIDELEKQVKKINNPEITDFYNYVNNNFNNGQLYMTVLGNIIKLKNMILINEKRDLLKQKIIETFNDLQKKDPKEINRKILEYILWYIESLHRLSLIPNIVQLINNNQIMDIILLIIMKTLLDPTTVLQEKKANDIIFDVKDITFKESIKDNKDYNEIIFDIKNKKRDRNKY